MIPAALKKAIRDAVKEHGTRGLARAVGLSAAYVSRVASGELEPADKLCRFLGWRKVTVYERVP